MADTIEITVPDIGDFTNIPVIDVLVKPGDRVNKEDSLITLESDKATMDVPAPAAGVVRALQVKVGDKVSKGSAILTLEANEGGAQMKAPAPSAPPAAKAPPAQPASPAPASPPAAGAAAAARGKTDIDAEVVVLGAGPGGYTAAFRAADLGKKVVLIERYPTLGGVCLNVGCIPSKALLHVAKVITEAADMAHAGVSFSEPKIDLAKLRDWKGGVVGKLTRGLSGLARQRKVQVVTGKGVFATPHSIKVETAEGTKTVGFDHCIIAAGSSAARIPGFPYDDRRVFDSTGALELPDIPER
ncbi:MAG: FAD-dependent oxidoreductase, partial [Betaproteobacteria bacterium]